MSNSIEISKGMKMAFHGLRYVLSCVYTLLNKTLTIYTFVTVSGLTTEIL